jgi:hypothetical protein
MLGKDMRVEQYLQIVHSEHRPRFMFDGQHINYITMVDSFQRDQVDTLWEVRFYLRMSDKIQKEYVSTYPLRPMLLAK